MTLISCNGFYYVRIHIYHDMSINLNKVLCLITITGIARSHTLWKVIMSWLQKTHSAAL